jgi:hypothetical protein
MRYNAFYGELPLEAFKPIGGRMRLYGGGDPISAVSDAVQGAINTVSDIGVSIDQTMRDVLPGGWTTAGLLAAGYYYQPEIAAYMNSAGSTVPIAEVTDAAVTTPAVTAPTTIADLGATPNIGTLPVAGPPVQVASLAPEAGLSSVTPAAITNAPSTALGDMLATGAGGGTTAGGIGGVEGALGAQAAMTAAGAATPSAGSSILSSLIPTTPIGQLAAISGATGLGSALITSDAAKKAADIQSAAAQNASALQGQMFNTINQQQAPYRSAGYGALNQLGNLGTGTYQMYDSAGNPTTMGTGTGYLQHQFGPADLTAGLAPNYDFMLSQGQMANQRQANVGGGAIGGNALQGLNKFTQDYAGNAYQNAFNNYQSQRTGIYNTLAGIAGIGQQGQTATNTAGTNVANAQSQLGVGSAAAQAAGNIGTASAYGNALGSLGSNLTLATLLNQRGNATLPLA